MQIITKGYRVTLEPEAKAYDLEAELSGEFERKVRTLAGNFQLIEDLPAVLNPLKNYVENFESFLRRHSLF